MKRDLFTFRRPQRQARRPRLAVEELEHRLAPSATPVLQYHNDLASTGQNLSETALTPANVNSSSFGKLFSTSVDGQVYAQPLYVPGLTVGGASHNLLLVATEHDSVYGLDADSGAVLWHQNYLQTGERTLTVADVGTNDLTPEVGITGTPVIDPSTNTAYFVTKATTAPAGTNASTADTVQRLHAVDLATGTEKFGGPVVIAASVNGTGDGNDGAGHVPFDALRNHQRLSLVLQNGVVYIGWSSHGDNGPYHGWVMGYSASTLQQMAVFNDTPNGTEGGIWESGGALSVDAAGNFYLTTGNGTFDTSLDANGMPSQHDFGDSVLKLAVDPASSSTSQNGNGWGLKVVDYFTPDNQATLNANDADIGSGGTLLLPDAAGSAAHPHLLLTAGKAGEIYLIDRDNMGHFDPNANHVVQDLPGALHAQLGNPAYFNGDVYYATPGFGTDNAKEYSIANGTLSASPVSKSPDTFTWRGGTVSVSANGTSNGVVWALDGGSNQLRAYSAAGLGTELYTSAQAANGRDALGTVVKFTVPTVTNGHVYVGTSNSVVGYGLLNNSSPGGLVLAIDAGGGAVGSFVADTDFSGGSKNHTTHAIDTSQVTNPAPQAVYQSWRAGNFTYTVPGLTPGATYTVRLDFAENVAAAAGQRVFNVAINGTRVLTRFDVFAAAGGRYKAIERQFTATADSAGHIAIKFTTVTGSARVNGIEVFAPTVNFAAGFNAAPGSLSFNGSAKLNGSRLELTDGGTNEAGSAFAAARVPVGSFVSRFSFQLTNPNADGIMFVLQGGGPAALGPSGGGLGFGPDHAGGTGGLANSVGVKFDLYNNAGEGVNSTGLYLNGATPTTPATDLTGTGIDLHSGHVFNVTLTYDGTTLVVKITDASTGASATQSYKVNIPSVVGSNTAFAGFTGGTGGLTATQDVLSWDYFATTV